MVSNYTIPLYVYKWLVKSLHLQCGPENNIHFLFLEPIEPIRHQNWLVQLRHLRTQEALKHVLILVHTILLSSISSNHMVLMTVTPVPKNATHSSFLLCRHYMHVCSIHLAYICKQNTQNKINKFLRGYKYSKYLLL